MKKREILPALLGCALRQEKVDESLLPLDWPTLLKQAKRHNVLPTLACVLPLLPEKPDAATCRLLEGSLMEQMLIGSNQLYAAQQLLEQFESLGIYGMALKGIRTKTRYPQDYMRTMGDLDILCKPEQSPAVRKAMETLGYSDFEPGRKHDHYCRKPYINVEMHRELVASSSPYAPYYRDVWQRTQPAEGCGYRHEMSATEEYIYSIIHLVEHFMHGGVGLRFIMDVFVYERFVTLDRELLKTQLKQLGLWDFYENVRILALYWFEEGEKGAQTEELAAYVFLGGVYGTAENASAAAVSKGGRLKFLLSACFPAFGEMCSMYPWLKKFPIGLPVAWVVRAVDSLLHRRGNIRSQFSAYAKGDMEKGRQLQSFYRRCGL